MVFFLLIFTSCINRAGAVSGRGATRAWVIAEQRWSVETCTTPASTARKGIVASATPVSTVAPPTHLPFAVFPMKRANYPTRPLLRSAPPQHHEIDPEAHGTWLISEHRSHHVPTIHPVEGTSSAHQRPPPPHPESTDPANSVCGASNCSGTPLDRHRHRPPSKRRPRSGSHSSSCVCYPTRPARPSTAPSRRPPSCSS